MAVEVPDEQQHPGTPHPGNQPAAPRRAVRFEHSVDLPTLLGQAEVTLLISTYQAGKVVALGTHQDRLAVSLHNFDRPMGIAHRADNQCLAIAGRDRIWILRSGHDLAPQLSPQGHHDAAWLTRQAFLTGEIQAHEMAFDADATLWIVNTLFSCLSAPDEHYSFVPRWRPPFVSAYAPEDRCHLNGLAIQDGQPRFVTAMAETDVAGGWREDKSRTGCVVDVASGETVARGFAMPHSPRIHDDALWLLDSGRGSLVRMDPRRGHAEVVARFPGYTRGLAIYHNWAFVGLSRIRETSTFNNIPIAEDRDRLKCGVAVVDLNSGRLLGQFEFQSGVEEIFDVAVLPNSRLAALRGPHAQEDGHAPVWVVPET